MRSKTAFSDQEDFLQKHKLPSDLCCSCKSKQTALGDVYFLVADLCHEGGFCGRNAKNKNLVKAEALIVN